MEFSRVPITTSTLVVYLNRAFSKDILQLLLKRHGGSFGKSSNFVMSMDGMDIKMMVFTTTIKINGVIGSEYDTDHIVYKIICRFVQMAYKAGIKTWRDDKAEDVSFTCRTPMINKNPRLVKLEDTEGSSPRMNSLTDFLYQHKRTMEAEFEDNFRITLINYEPNNGGTKIFVETMVPDATYQQRIITIKTGRDALCKLELDSEIPELHWHFDIFSGVSMKHRDTFDEMVDTLKELGFKGSKTLAAMEKKLSLFNVVKFSLATKGGLSISGRDYGVMETAYNNIVPTLLENIDSLLVIPQKEPLMYNFGIVLV